MVTLIQDDNVFGTSAGLMVLQDFVLTSYSLRTDEYYIWKLRLCLNRYKDEGHQ